MDPGQEPSTLRNVRKRVLSKILKDQRTALKRKEAIESAMKSLPAHLREKLKSEGVD